jgi:hypothetical protein
MLWAVRVKHKEEVQKSNKTLKLKMKICKLSIQGKILLKTVC